MADRQLDPDALARPEPLRRIDKIMETVGLALLPIGLTALLVGWLGVASNGHVFLQLPYLVSGGLLGIGLIFASGTIYLASWISRSATVQRQQNAELIRAVGRLQQTVAMTSLGGGNGTSHTTGRFLATPSGSMFHRPDCAVVTDREDLREVDPEAKGMKPCGMCAPLDVDATTVMPAAN